MCSGIDFLEIRDRARDPKKLDEGPKPLLRKKKRVEGDSLIVFLALG
jgi:hypothetical protein